MRHILIPLIFFLLNSTAIHAGQDILIERSDNKNQDNHETHVTSSIIELKVMMSVNQEFNFTHGESIGQPFQAFQIAPDLKQKKESHYLKWLVIGVGVVEVLLASKYGEGGEGGMATFLYIAGAGTILWGLTL